MLIVTMATHGEQAEKAFGCIGCNQIAPVNDYQLVAANGHDGTCITTLPNYPRWTEPAYALLARLLSHHPRDANIPVPGGHLRSTIYLGKNLATARAVECLEADIVEGNLRTSHQDDFGTHYAKGTARKNYLHPLDILEHSSRLAVWGKDEEPPLPPPLTDVPIHDDGGHPYVLAEKIPEYTRRFLERRRLGCAVPRPGAYYASDWWQFIGGRP